MKSTYLTGNSMRVIIPPSSTQRGSTLLVGLIMLILLTLMAISAMNATTSGLQIIGNAQFREEATAAAQQAIERVISSNFTLNVANSSSNTSSGATSSTVSFGAASYNVQVETPVCTSSVAITNGELNPAVAADQNCLGSGQYNGPTRVDPDGKPIPTAASWCYKQKWDIRATVDDPNTGANIALHQGVYMRVPVGTVCP